MTVPAVTRPTRSTGWGEWVPLCLVALVLIPAMSGSLRLVEVFGGPQLLPANPRIAASPVPVVVHIMCADRGPPATGSGWPGTWMTTGHPGSAPSP